MCFSVYVFEYLSYVGGVWEFVNSNGIIFVKNFVYFFEEFMYVWFVVVDYVCRLEFGNGICDGGVWKIWWFVVYVDSVDVEIVNIVFELEFNGRFVDCFLGDGIFLVEVRLFFVE